MKGSEFIAPNSERAFQEAKMFGLEVILPKANELQIDIDSPEDREIFNHHFGIFQKYEQAEIVRDEPSKSNEDGKRHITVELQRDISNLERILLQAVLGSDRKREILSWVQHCNGDAHPTLFLEKAQKLLTVSASQ